MSRFFFFCCFLFVSLFFQPSKDDGQNNRNNIVTVKKSDFEVMEALQSDSILSNNQTTNLRKQQCKII